MLFYELACHPAVFNKSYILDNDVAIKQVLKNIAEKGSIANLNGAQWILVIEEYIASLNDEIIRESNLKKQFQTLLKTLETRKKIIHHGEIKNVTDWLEIIYSYQIDEFSAILNTSTTEKTYTPPDLLDSDLWDNITRTSSEYAIQDEEYIKSEIAPILHNAQQIDLIDPYFDITEDRYRKPFKIIIDSLSNQGYNRQVSLTIHIKNQNNNKPDVLDRTKYLERWQEIFKSHEDLNVQCILCVWHESRVNEMHDRHIIRDESFGATLPTGIDERKKNKTMWHDMGHHNVDYVLNDFRSDSSPFKLVAEVTKDEKKVWINGILQKNSNLSIEEKLANKKDFRKK